MDYIDVATTGKLSPHVLPVEDLREILKHIKETLPSTMHLPISSEDTLHCYRYLHTHIPIADEQFLLVIDVSIKDHAQQIEVYEEILTWISLTEITYHTMTYKTSIWG